jgi:hypothetical protein
MYLRQSRRRFAARGAMGENGESLIFIFLEIPDDNAQLVFVMMLLVDLLNQQLNAD